MPIVNKTGDPIPCEGCGAYYGQHIEGCPSQPNREVAAMLSEIRADIDYACTAIMKLKEQTARARLEQTLLRIDAALSPKEPGQALSDSTEGEP